MTITTFAYGRLSLPAPSITILTGGSIQGLGNTYYFWTIARNRVGYNSPSTVRSSVIANSSRVRLNAATFTQSNYEDWRHYCISVSTTNNFSTSRIIYKQEFYESDQITPITMANVFISDDFVLNGDVNIPNIASLPLNVPNGFRVNLLSIGKVFEFIVNSTKAVDNLTVIQGTGGNWELVDSNSLIETVVNCNKELYQVTKEDLITVPIETLISDSLPTKFYLINDTGNPFTSGELDLNEYISDKSLEVTFNIKLLGYLNLSTYTLDTSGISNINTVISYPENTIQLSKTLPANSAFVLELYPEISDITRLLSNTIINVYPKLNDYFIVESVKYYGDPAIDIASLKSIPASLYRPNQVRFVYSKQTFYYFDESSALADNGDTVLIPNDNPLTGRWRSLTFSIANGSITVDKLNTDVLDLLNNEIKVEIINIPLSTDLTIDLDTTTNDYFIINTPLEDGDVTTINVIGTLLNNSASAIAIELRQKTGVVEFNNSLVFPGGSIPTFSGNNKIDLFVVTLVKDDLGILKKRIFLVQKDIG